MKNKRITINEIFRMYINDYKKKYADKISAAQYKVIKAILNCRTSQLGTHIKECDYCRQTITLFNSCRNRHCPQCQNIKKEEWLFNRKKEILPVPYYHVIFTLPDELNPLIYSNQKKLLPLFFKAASETLKVLSSDSKHLGASIGFIMVLHTWSQNLLYHPHIHCIVPGGGFNSDKTEWVHPRYKNFFMPVKVISDLFKKKFLAKLKYLYFHKEPLHFAGTISYLKNAVVFNNFIDNLKHKKWVVYCAKPFKRPNIVIDYLGRYVYKVAISPYRIITIENNQIYFYWKDYRDKKTKVMKLSPVEFIRRILLHVLPHKFQKVRYYGLLGNNKKIDNISLCRQLFNVVIDAFSELLSSMENDIRQIIYFFKGIDIAVCPFCGKGRMITKNVSRQTCSHSPPYTG